MRALRDSMTSTVQRHLVVLERIFHQAVETNDTVDMFHLLNRFTMEAFTEISFGAHMNCLDADKEHPFQTAFDRSQQLFVLRFVRPSWFWKTQRLLDRSRGPSEKEHGRDQLYYLRHWRQRHHSLFLDDLNKSGDADESCFDPTYLRDIVVNFIIAGRDTTVQALSWFFYCLSKNPQVEAKIREEVAAKLPKLFNGQCSPSMDEVGCAKGDAASVSFCPHCQQGSSSDTVLSDGTFIAMYALGRMPHVWGPDAAEFKAELWIDSGKLISVSAYQFVAFNAGPRLCLGKNLAMLEMKLIVASLLSKYHVELESPENVTYAISFTLPVKGQLNAKITAV
ncbi:Cytochrome P450, conserved site [Phytophthora cactorum]|nr:Cytochrome P450, conserved site [Phytophthora cactorum]